MSETPAERAPRGDGGPVGQDGGQGGGNFLTNKLGPFPVWVWLAVVGGLVAWRLYANKSASAAAAVPVTTPSTPADQVPQFVNQTYTTVTAPPAPAVTTPAAPGTPAPSPAPNPPPFQVGKYAKPRGLTSSVTGHTGTITWLLSGQPSPAPKSYTVAVYTAKGKPVSTQTVDVPDTTGGRGTVTIPNLPKGTLHANVWPNGGAQAPENARTTLTVK